MPKNDPTRARNRAERDPLFRKIALIFILMLGLSPARADTLPPMEASIDGDCFGKFATYDDWAAFMREKNGFFLGTLVSFKINEEDFAKAKAAVDCKYLTYESDGLPVRGIMVYPKAPSGKLPTIIYNRGGNGSYGAMNFTLMFPYIFPIAQKGFAVFISQYRGIDNRTGVGSDQFGGKDVNDVLAMIDVAQKFPFTDQDNLFMLGQSRGAMMSYLALARSETPFRASATVGSLVDLLAWQQERPEVKTLFEARIPGFAEHGERALVERSALYWPEKLPRETRYLLMHGTDDTRVSWMPAKLLSNRLTALGVDASFKSFEGDDHTLSTNRKQAIEDIVAFFRASMQ